MKLTIFIAFVGLVVCGIDAISVKSALNQYPLIGTDEDLYCYGCKTTAIIISKLFALIPKRRVKADLKYLCRLTPLQQACLRRVEVRFNDIYDKLLEILSPKMCSFVGICADPNLGQLYRNEVVERDVKENCCDKCKQFVKRLKCIVTSYDKNRLRSDVEKSCETIPLLKNTCADLIHQYFDKVYIYILEILNPNSCMQTNLCNSEMPTGKYDQQVMDPVRYYSNLLITYVEQ